MLKVRSASIGILLTVVSMLAACSGIPRRERDEQALERYMQYAGEPISSFSILGGVDNWRSVGDDKLVVWTSISQAYLLTVQPPCNGLSFATRIALTSTGSTVSKGFDSVRFQREKCRVGEIRPIDYRRLQQDARQKSDG